MELIELINSKYADTIHEMVKYARGGDSVVTEENVYQPGNPTNWQRLRSIMTDMLLPGSGILGFENIAELAQLSRKKRHCLILMEHYSNFDLPNLLSLLEDRGEEGKAIKDSIVAVAGVKLNEESAVVLAFTEIFTRVVLFPARSMEGITDPKKRIEAEWRRAKLNIAAMKTLMKLRREGRIILVFPTGTRYRPWDPSTTRGLKEIDSYLKFYSHMVTISINGNTLLPNRVGGMMEDFPVKDVVIYTVSPVMKCSEFRREAMKSRTADQDPKQHVVDRVMENLAQMHETAEKLRLPLLPHPE